METGFAWQVGAGEGNLAEADEADFRADEADDGERAKMGGGLPGGPERQADGSFEQPDGENCEQDQRAAGGGAGGGAALEAGEAEGPVSTEIERQGEDDTCADDGEHHHEDTGGPGGNAGFAPGIGVGTLGELAFGGWILEQHAGEGEAEAEIEGEDHAVLAGAEERADGELADGRLALVSEAGKPTEAACAGDDVGLLDDVAEGAPVGERVADRGDGEGNGEALPGADGKGCKSGVEGAVELLVEGEKPVGGQKVHDAPDGAAGEVVEAAEAGLEEVETDDGAERRELEVAGEAEEVAAQQELGGEALEGEERCVNEEAGREHGEPVGGVGAENARCAAGRGDFRGAE